MKTKFKTREERIRRLENEIKRLEMSMNISRENKEKQDSVYDFIVPWQL